MSIHLRHYGKIEKGKMIYFNKPLFDQQLLNLEGQEFEMVIKKRFHKVSNDQFSYYFGAVLRVAHKHDAFIHFNKPDDIHEDIIAPMFLGYTRVIEFQGKKIEKKEVRSTTSLTKEEMAEFIDRVIMWLAAEFDIVVYSPEAYYLSLQNNNYGN